VRTLGTGRTSGSRCGIVALAWFVIGLATGWSIRKEEEEASDTRDRLIEPARDREFVNN